MNILIFSLLASFPSWAAVQKGTATLQSPDKKITGTIQVIPSGDSVRVISVVRGLRPGSAHGFHIHEKGKCEAPSFESAGPHYNPEKGPHGAPTSTQKHAGDLGNLVADDSGTAKAEVVLKGLSREEVQGLYGKAVIVHDKTDDLRSQPSGDSGKRLACGIIEPQKN